VPAEGGTGRRHGFGITAAVSPRLVPRGLVPDGRFVAVAVGAADVAVAASAPM
jgi:hypothetical protein